MTANGTVAMSDLPWLDVMADEFREDPYPALRELRGRDFAASERGLEVLSYKACVEVLRDSTLAVGFEDMLEASGIHSGPTYDSLKDNINNLEGEAHDRLRRVIAPYFQPASVERLRAQLRDAIDDRIDEVREEGRCNIVDLLGHWLPTLSFCTITGAPLEDSPFIWRMSDEVQRFFQRNPIHKEIVETGFADVAAYIDDLIETRRSQPGTDLISHMLEAEATGDLSQVEMRDLAILLLLGSTDTTNAQLSCIFRTLADSPDEWQQLRAQPELVPNGVLEGARHAPGVWAMTRVTRAAQTVGGQAVGGVEVPVDTMIFTDFISANRDPSVYDDPDRLDVTRKLGRPPLNWSVGTHFCPGRPLAVMELEETLAAAVDRWETFELDGPFVTQGAPYVISASSLPVRFEAAERVGDRVSA